MGQGNMMGPGGHDGSGWWFKCQSKECQTMMNTCPNNIACTMMQSMMGTCPANKTCMMTEPMVGTNPANKTCMMMQPMMGTCPAKQDLHDDAAHDGNLSS